MSEEHEHRHELTAKSIGHVHAINPEVTVSADIVRCTCGASPPAIGVAVGWQEDGEQTFSAALLDPAKALSIAQAILAAVGQVISTSGLDDAVAEAMKGRDWDAELVTMLEQEHGHGHDA